MDLASIVTASSAVFVAVAGYWFSKKKEREAELRKEKLEHYKDFVACLAGVIGGESTEDDHRAFALACNKFNLMASQSAIISLQRFQDEIAISNDNKNKNAHDQLMTELFYEMRKDLKVNPKDEKDTFSTRLWASGHPPKQL